jgi:hypothetical protein
MSMKSLRKSPIGHRKEEEGNEDLKKSSGNDHDGHPSRSILPTRNAMRDRHDTCDQRDQGESKEAEIKSLAKDAKKVTHLQF